MAHPSCTLALPPMKRALPVLLLACLAAGSAQAIKLSKERMVFQTGDGVALLTQVACLRRCHSATLSKSPADPAVALALPRLR